MLAEVGAGDTVNKRRTITEIAAIFAAACGNPTCYGKPQSVSI
jgi:hypothetical protein